jgi:hypothetical protein
MADGSPTEEAPVPRSLFRPLALLLAALPVLVTVAVAAPPPAAAQAEVRPIVFPVEGPVRFSDSWHAPRSGGRVHLGVDIMGDKLQRLLAAVDGTVTWIRHDTVAGNNLRITDSQGWTYHYVHINNDTPGTDDGANPREWAFIGNLQRGDEVKAGQPIAYLGDSGNAEDTAPHLHFEIHRPDGTPINPYHSVVAARSGTVTPPGSFDGRLWLADQRGRVFSFGRAGHFDDARSLQLNKPIVGMAPTAAGGGYWLLGQDGGVFSYGDATFFGSTGGMRLNQPVNGMAATPSGRGYWLVASDGGIFAFGDAGFFGSTGGIRLNKPVNGMAPTSTGRGYWLVASDGGIFAFGDARFHGSAVTRPLGAPTVGIATKADGSGYWVAASNGKVAAFGGAEHHGDLPSLPKGSAPIARIQAAPDGNGYWLISTDGTVRPYGSAAPTGAQLSASGIVAAAAR